MRILISGSTGLLGTSVIRRLEGEGHEAVRLVRPATRAIPAMASAKTILWDPSGNQFDAAKADGADALVHLAGASIADGRWNAARKNLLRTSRIDATRHLIAALSGLQRPPAVIVSASAIGYYGNRADEELTESSAPGNDFLAKLCVDWEAEVARATQFGVRAVMLRFGIILAAHGGALPRMVLPFKLGVGGKLGSGRQWMSWLTLEEAVNMIHFALMNAALTGPANAVTPAPVRNADFTRALAKVLHRPALFPAPAFALRLALGEMAGSLLLASQLVVPSKPAACGYNFLHTDLNLALKSALEPVV
ncbi:MAG: TIGR01777 family oxidoreductase [Candidatus Acidiferrales bacterium]